MKILFTSDGNGHLIKDPFAWEYEYKGWLPKFILFPIMRALEFTQCNGGGSLCQLQEDLDNHLGIKIKQLSEGNKSGYPYLHNEYKLVSGNY